jgi:hypothetical protein
MIVFQHLQVGRLSKQQEIASENPHQRFEQCFPRGILILIFDCTPGKQSSPQAHPFEVEPLSRPPAHAAGTREHAGLRVEIQEVLSEATQFADDLRSVPRLI